MTNQENEEQAEIILEFINESVDLLPTDDCNPPRTAVCITATYSM